MEKTIIILAMAALLTGCASQRAVARAAEGQSTERQAAAMPAVEVQDIAAGAQQELPQ